MKLISINCISKVAIFYSSLYVIFDFLYFYLYKLITNEFDINDDNRMNINYIYLCLMKSLSNILLIILYYILNKKNEEDSNDDNKLSKSGINSYNIFGLQIQIIVFKEKHSSNINFTTISFIFICSLIDFFILFYNKQIITSGFTFFFGFILFSYIYKHTIYLHHYFGLIIIIIIAIAKTIIFFIEKENQKNDNIISLVIYSLLGFQIVIEKYLIEIRFVNKILILTFEGIFELVFLIVYVIIYYENHNYKLFSNFYYFYILIFLVDLFVNFSRINSIEHNRNIVSLLIFIFSQFISSHIFKLHDKKTENNQVYFTILEIINIFGCLILMELLILNFCKMNKNIVSQIKKREELDMQIIK